MNQLIYYLCLKYNASDEEKMKQTTNSQMMAPRADDENRSSCKGNKGHGTFAQELQLKNKDTQLKRQSQGDTIEETRTICVSYHTNKDGQYQNS
jgi:hypothetical protein